MFSIPAAIDGLQCKGRTQLLDCEKVLQCVDVVSSVEDSIKQTVYFHLKSYSQFS